MAADRPERVVLETRALPSSLDEVHDLVERLWATAPEVTEQDRMRFTLVVAEVAANVVEHAARGEPVRMLLVLHARPDRIEAYFEDGGAPYSVGSEGSGDGLPESGRGLAMARAIAQEVAYERDGPLNRWLVSMAREQTVPT